MFGKKTLGTLVASTQYRKPLSGVPKNKDDSDKQTLHTKAIADRPWWMRINESERRMS